MGVDFTELNGPAGQRNPAEPETILADDAATILASLGGICDPVGSALCPSAYFEECLAQAVVDAGRTERHFTVFMIGVDPSATFGDFFDLRAGAVEAAGRRIGWALDATMVAGRLAADRIAVLCDPAGPREAVRIAQAFVAALREPIRLGDEAIELGASIGIAVFPQDGGDADALLRHAEEAVRIAKSGGHGRWSFISSARTARAEQRVRLEPRLRHAIEHSAFQLHFQPKICLRSGAICGLEALARWRDPQLGTVPPSLFIPVAEEAGLIDPIGEWALTEACRFLTAAKAVQVSVPNIAVNLSAAHILKRDLVSQVLGIAASHGVPPESLVIEITESAVIAEPAQAIRTLHELRESGVGIAIDDFGTGYSSLAYLKQLPVDILKLDKTFVADIVTSQTDQRIVRTVVALGHVLGMCVVAEGVEDEAQAARLARWGVDAGQGYFYARPMAGPDLLEWMAGREVARRSEMCRRCRQGRQPTCGGMEA